MVEKIGGMTAQSGVVTEKKREMIAQVGKWLRRLGNDCANWGMAAQAGEGVHKRANVR